jgi:hypothetical protein
VSPVSSLVWEVNMWKTVKTISDLRLTFFNGKFVTGFVIFLLLRTLIQFEMMFIWQRYFNICSFHWDTILQAGIKSKLLIIALEPEAAALYVKQIPVDSGLDKDSKEQGTFAPGSKYIVVDAGGMFHSQWSTMLLRSFFFIENRLLRLQQACLSSLPLVFGCL